MSAFNTSEIYLAENLGINRKKLANFRLKNLRKFKDYTLLNNTICYSESGVAAIKAKFAKSIVEEAPVLVYPNFILIGKGVSWASPKRAKYTMLPAPSQHLVEDAFEAVERAKKDFPTELIIKTVPRNTRILICHFEEGEIIVHIRDNSLFVAGMSIPVHRLGDRVEFNGKLPRRKGVLI